MPGDPARPLVVVWRVTEACDLGCWFCEYNRQLRRSRRSARAGDVLAFGKVLADYAASTGRAALVSWLGGEPLLWPPLVEVGMSLRQDCGLQLSLTTNGGRLGGPGLIQHLVDNYAEVTVSVDGLAGFHDLARGAPGLWERLRVSIGELREGISRRGRGPLLRANTLLMRSNLRAFEQLCQTLAGWGIEEVTFNALGGQPPGRDYALERLTAADIDWFQCALPGIRKRLAGCGLTIRGGARYLSRLAASASGQMLPVLDCHPGAEFLFVNERGRIAPCSYTTEGYGVPISELRSGADLAQLPALMAERRQLALMPPCHDCPSTQVFGKFDLAGAP